MFNYFRKELDWGGRKLVLETGKVVIAHEDSLSFGYGAEIAARIADECFAWLDAPVKRIASQDVWVGYAPQLEDVILPQKDTMLRAIRLTIGKEFLLIRRDRVGLFMLLVLFVQAGTGLFANDDIATEGPLYKWVSKAASDRLTSAS